MSHMHKIDQNSNTGVMNNSTYLTSNVTTAYYLKIT